MASEEEEEAEDDGHCRQSCARCLIADLSLACMLAHYKEYLSLI